MIQVPKERVQQFADEYGLSFNEASDQYHAVAKHLAANPVMPTDIATSRFLALDENGNRNSIEYIVAEWQRRMFLAPETHIPADIDDLRWDGYLGSTPDEDHNRGILEAYRRGKASR